MISVVIMLLFFGIFSALHHLDSMEAVKKTTGGAEYEISCQGQSLHDSAGVIFGFAVMGNHLVAGTSFSKCAPV